ncbi:unnamed protein product [Calypogeia fissa]
MSDSSFSTDAETKESMIFDSSPGVVSVEPLEDERHRDAQKLQRNDLCRCKNRSSLIPRRSLSRSGKVFSITPPAIKGVLIRRSHKSPLHWIFVGPERLMLQPAASSVVCHRLLADTTITAKFEKEKGSITQLAQKHIVALQLDVHSVAGKV